MVHEREKLWAKLSLIWVAMIALAFLCLSLGVAFAFLYLAVGRLGLISSGFAPTRVLRGVCVLREPKRVHGPR